MDTFKCFWIISSIVILSGCNIIAEQYFGDIGGDVIFTCEYPIPSGGYLLSLSWTTKQTVKLWDVTRASNGTYLDRKNTGSNLDILKAYNDVSLDAGMHSIQIRNLDLKDEGSYRCEFAFHDGAGDYVEGESGEQHKFELIVTVPPTPSVQFINATDWLEDTKVEIQCAIPRVKPMITQFYLERGKDRNFDKDAAALSQIINDDNMTYTVNQANSVVLKWTDFMMTRFTCVAVWRGEEYRSEGKIVEELKFSPRQSPEKDQDLYASIGEETTVELYFHSNPGPSEVRCEGFSNSKAEKKSEPGLFVISLVIPEVTEESFTSYECTVRNEIGEAMLNVALWDFSSKNSGTVAGIVIGCILILLVCAAAVGFYIWKKRQNHDKPKRHPSVYDAHEQNGNYEPYEIADERRQKVTPQLPMTEVKTSSQIDDATYDVVNTNVKPIQNGTEYSDVYVKQLPPGQKPLVIRTAPPTEYSTVEFDDSAKRKVEDSDSD